MPRIVCISDTHGRHDAIAVPDGDVLIHAGDLSMMGREAEIEAFAEWFGALPHRHRIVIAGNHDWLFERSPQRARELLGDVTYLRDDAVEIDGLVIWGSPWQPWFHDWAFNLRRGEEIRAKWDLIPEGTDVLVTHGPPFGHLDGVPRAWFAEDDAIAVEHVGCEELEIALARVQPRLHVFGHIHEGYGQSVLGETILVNASTCDADYQPVNPAIVVDLP
jgi:predicted phosphohydrolase